MNKNTLKDFITDKKVVAAGLGLSALVGLGLANGHHSEAAPAPQTPAATTAAHEQKPATAPQAPAAPDQDAVIAHKLALVAVKDKKPTTSDQEVEANMKTMVDSFAERGMTSPRVIAYAAATMEHETAKEYKPIEEYGGREQAKRLGYQGGEDYFGRGYVQLTHKDNYAKVGADIGLGDILVQYPDKALEPPVAGDVMADFFATHGVAKDAETGSFVDAREGVNGTDRAELVAGYADEYLAALQK